MLAEHPHQVVPPPFGNPLITPIPIRNDFYETKIVTRLARCNVRIGFLFAKNGGVRLPVDSSLIFAIAHGKKTSLFANPSDDSSNNMVVR